MKKFFLMVVFATAPSAYQISDPTPPASESRGIESSKVSSSSEFTTAATMDAIVKEAIGMGQIPGAVVVVGHKGRVVFEKAYGDRSLIPHKEPMTLDTVFDVASLTKVVATTSAIAKLVEEGKIRLTEKVTTYLPEFQGGKSDVTVQNLLTHFSGMRPDVDLEPAWSGYETGIRLATMDRPIGLPRLAVRIQRHQLRASGRNCAPDVREDAAGLRSGKDLRAARECPTRCFCRRSL